MADIDFDQLGPVDYLVVGFPAEKADFSGAMAAELKKLLAGGTIRMLDLMIVTKAADGTVEAAELRDRDDSEVGELRALEADVSLVLASEDVERVGAELEPWEHGCCAGLGEHVGGPARISNPSLRWGADRHGPDPDPGADRRSRGGSRGGPSRSVIRTLRRTR